MCFLALTNLLTEFVLQCKIVLLIPLTASLSLIPGIQQGLTLSIPYVYLVCTLCIHEHIFYTDSILMVYLIYTYT